MRLDFIEPANLTAEQKPLYDDMKTGIETNFKGFQAVRPDGVLIGPLESVAAFSQDRQAGMGAC